MCTAAIPLTSQCILDLCGSVVNQTFYRIFVYANCEARAVTLLQTEISQHISTSSTENESHRL